MLIMFVDVGKERVKSVSVFFAFARVRKRSFMRAEPSVYGGGKGEKCH